MSISRTPKPQMNEAIIAVVRAGVWWYAMALLPLAQWGPRRQSVRRLVQKLERGLEHLILLMARLRVAPVVCRRIAGHAPSGFRRRIRRNRLRTFTHCLKLRHRGTVTARIVHVLRTLDALEPHVARMAKRLPKGARFDAIVPIAPAPLLLSAHAEPSAPCAADSS